MPILNQQVPQESPPRPQQAPPAAAPSGPAFTFQHGVQTPRNLMSALLEENIRKAREDRNRPWTKGFMSDMLSMATGTATDLMRMVLGPTTSGARMTQDMLDTGQLSGTDMLRQDLEATQQEGNQRLQSETNPSLVDLVVPTFAKGFVSGFDWGLKHLPVVGDYFEATIGPVNEALEVAARSSIQRNLSAMESKLGRGGLVELPAIVSGLGGTLIGGYLPLKPWMMLGNVMISGSTRVRQAASFAEGLKDVGKNLTAIQSGFVGDMAGMSVFGAVTGERGMLLGLANPAVSTMGQRLLEMDVDPRDPWWKQGIAQTVNRGEAAASMGIDGFVLSALFMTGSTLATQGAYAISKIREMRFSLMGGERVDGAKIMAMRQARILTDPGKRRFAVLRTPAEGEAFVDAIAHEELIAASSGAQKLLAENTAVEGIVSYHTQMAALIKAIDELHVSGEATHGVLRGVDDPYRMLQEIRSAKTPLEGARIASKPQAARIPLSHTPDEIPEAGVFGYTEGGSRDPIMETLRKVDRNTPLFLKNRPKAPAVERGSVEEIVVVPAKTWEYDAWNNVMEKHGSVDDMLRAARRNNVDMITVRNTGGPESYQHIVVNPTAIKSSKPVLPAHTQKLMSEPVDADRILAELGEEPLEVALKRRMPGYRFETPIRREDGSYDLIFAPEGAPGLSNKQLKQFKNTGYFTGQRVMYGGKTWEVVRRRGKTGQGSSLEIKDPTTGTTRSVSRNNVFELPSAHGGEMPVDEALYRDWLEFFDGKLKMIGDRSPDEPTLRAIAMATKDPARLQRDQAGQGINAIIHPHETMADLDVADTLAARIMQIDQQLTKIGPDFTQAAQIQVLVRERNALQAQVQEAAKKAQTAGRISEDIDLDKAFVDFPDEMDYGTVAFQEWAGSRGIPLNPGEAQALKYQFYRRMNAEVFQKLPEDLRVQYQKIQDELMDHWDKLPDTLESTAAFAGFEVMRLKNNTIVLRRPGSLYYEGMFSSDEAARAALQRSIRYAGTPNMTPQYNYMDMALPSGPGHGSTGGMVVEDLLFKTGDEALEYLNGEYGNEMWLPKSKAAFFTSFEEKTGIPIWTNHMEPLFTAKNRADNAAVPFQHDYVKAFGRLSQEDRAQISDFIRTIESHSLFVDIDKVVVRAKDYGLNRQQISAVRGMRDVMDDMFQVGTRLYGWMPEDFLYNYLTKMWPREQAFSRGDMIPPNEGRLYSDLVSEEMDIFASKYRRNGMLPKEETDPLIIGMKYIRAFFHEAYVRRPYENLAGFINTKLKDLPTEQANLLIENMEPALKRKTAGAAGGNIMNAMALPNQIRLPLKEMLEYIRGTPKATTDMTVRIIRSISDSMGVRIDDRTAEAIVNAGMLELYGALLALRPKPVVRNVFQVIGNLGSRTSFAAVDIGMSRAFSPQAFARAVDDGIIDLTSHGLPFGEQMTMDALEAGAIETRGVHGWFFGGILKGAVLNGTIARLWKRSVEKGLSGIGTTDMFTRVAAAETADVFVRPWVNKYVAGKIDATKLVDKALPYWETSIRNKFVQTLDEQGSEAAMTYIRRETSNITNYIYAKYAQPTAMQSTGGRLLGQFGIWPMWRKDLVVRSIKNARSMDERASYFIREAMIWGGLRIAGMRLGISLVPWMANEGMFTYSGGPAVQAIVDLQTFMSQRDNESRWNAAKNLAYQNVFRLGPPGRVFGEDVINSIKYAQDDPMRGAMHLLFGRPTTDDLSWSERLIYMTNEAERERRALGGGEMAPSPPVPQAIPMPQMLPPGDTPLP